ncbi:MAG: phosphoribosylglycinamide formyltransferase, partial [Eubacterium sp.]|nr:phosphoribosylglycinamide formyltransferase [Eubacterium sp.]
MLRIAVLVSGGGTNLQAIMDSLDSGAITNAQLVTVISNNKNAYALKRAENYGVEGLLISPRDFPSREDFNLKLLEALLEREIDLVVLAGY